MITTRGALYVTWTGLGRGERGGEGRKGEEGFLWLRGRGRARVGVEEKTRAWMRMGGEVMHGIALVGVEQARSNRVLTIFPYQYLFPSCSCACAVAILVLAGPGGVGWVPSRKKLSSPLRCTSGAGAPRKRCARLNAMGSHATGTSAISTLCRTGVVMDNSYDVRYGQSSSSSPSSP